SECSDSGLVPACHRRSIGGTDMRHRFHSICPYFAMFPESFAEQWISALSAPGEVVLDPFAGRGTAPFQALLMGRIGVGADINPVAACLNLAKLNPPAKKTLLDRLRDIRRSFEPPRWRCSAAAMPPFFHHAYHRHTLAELLYLRGVLDWRRRRTDSFLASLVLGALHGEASSSRYLS